MLCSQIRFHPFTRKRLNTSTNIQCSLTSDRLSEYNEIHQHVCIVCIQNQYCRLWVRYRLYKAEALLVL